MTTQTLAVLRALWPLIGNGPLVIPCNRHIHKPMSTNAIGHLLNRGGYHGHHVPHAFRAAFSTIMNEWSERHGKDHDRQGIDLMPAHVPKEKVDGAYNRAAYMPRRRELDHLGSNAEQRLPEPTVLVDRPIKALGRHSRRRSPLPTDAGFRFPRSPRELMVRRSD